MAENQLIPGQPLRNGVDLVADKKTGALIVIGTSAKLEKISSGGIILNNCSYTPEMLSELAKMDGGSFKWEVFFNVTNSCGVNITFGNADITLLEKDGSII